MRLPNGFGAVIKLGGKRRKPFAVRITDGFEQIGEKNGTPQFRQKFKYLDYFETRKDALAFLVKYNENPAEAMNNITFKELYEEWFSRKVDKVSRSTIDGYKSMFKKCSALHDTAFKDIRAEHLQRIVDENAHMSHVSLQQMKTFFNMLYTYAERYDFEKNYSKFVELPAKKKTKKRPTYSVEEINRLWQNLDVENADILLMLLYTGVRATELFELKTENIHLEKRYFFVEKSKTPEGVRNVPIHKKVLPLFQARYNTAHKYLFQNKRGEAMLYNSFLRSQYKALREYFELNHTIHDTRHTFISQCDRLELNTVSVQRIVGHKNKTVTQHYTDKTLEDIIKTIDLFDY